MTFNEKIEAYGSEAESLKGYYWFLYLCAAASAYMMFYCSRSMQIPSIIVFISNVIVFFLSTVSIFTFRKLNQNSYAFSVALGIALAAYPIVLAGYLCFFLSPSVVFYGDIPVVYCSVIVGMVIIHMCNDKKRLFFGTDAEVVAHGKKETERLQHITSRQPITNTETTSADELLKYKKLLDDGAITQEEYDTKKRKLLSDKPEKQPVSSIHDDSTPTLEPVKPQRFGCLKSVLSLCALFLCAFGWYYFTKYEPPRRIPTYDPSSYTVRQKEIVDVLQAANNYAVFSSGNSTMINVYCNEERESYDIVFIDNTFTADAIQQLKKQMPTTKVQEYINTVFYKDMRSYSLSVNELLKVLGSSYDAYIYMADGGNHTKYLILAHNGEIVDTAI